MFKAWKALMTLFAGSSTGVTKIIADEPIENEKTHLDSDNNTEIITTFSVGSESIGNSIETLDVTHHKEH